MIPLLGGFCHSSLPGPHGPVSVKELTLTTECFVTAWGIPAHTPQDKFETDHNPVVSCEVPVLPLARLTSSSKHYFSLEAEQSEKADAGLSKSPKRAEQCSIAAEIV